MPENSRRGVAVVQRQIVDASRSISWECLLCQVSLLATLVVMAAGESHLDFCRERKANKRPARRGGASSGRIFRRQIDHRQPNAIALVMAVSGLDGRDRWVILLETRC